MKLYLLMSLSKQYFGVLIIAFLVLTRIDNLMAQGISFEEYNPKSTLVVPENPVKRARFPFIDIHSHQRNVSEETITKLVQEMDEINMGVMVNLSGRGGAGHRMIPIDRNI
jgi:hypothetical protein